MIVKGEIGVATIVPVYMVDVTNGYTPEIASAINHWHCRFHASDDGAVSTELTNDPVEIDSTNMAGHYYLTVTAGEQDAEGALQGDIVGHDAAHAAVTRVFPFVVMVEGASQTNIHTDIATAQTAINRILGLSFDNLVVDDTTYDGSDRMTAANFYLYSDAAGASAHSVGGGAQAGCVDQYAYSATYDGDGLQIEKCVRTALASSSISPSLSPSASLSPSSSVSPST